MEDLNKVEECYKNHSDLLYILEDHWDVWLQYQRLKTQQIAWRKKLLALLEESFESRDHITHDRILSILKYKPNNEQE